MKYPVYVAFEPRTRQRFWTAIRRAGALARGALAEATGLPATFVVSLMPPKPGNKQRPHPVLWIVGHTCGSITSIISTTSLP